MPPLNPQHYRYEGEQLGIAEDVLANAEAIIARIRKVDPRLPVVFTLRHLSALTGVQYYYLRRVVARDPDIVPYRHFSLRKKIPGRSRRRLISVPPKSLMIVQRWIVDAILANTTPAAASFAFHRGSRPVFAAQAHCGCDWLLKVDIADFFHSISEGQVFSVFNSLGYPKLLAFELARLTTIEGNALRTDPAKRWPVIPYYQYPSEGRLPQGAPTSPMLANLVMRKLDDRLTAMATANDLRYTRYADDLAFSGRKPHTLETMRAFRTSVLAELDTEGFAHNRRKTVIRGPGARRIVLGILVDGVTTRLARDYKDRLQLHLHYLRSSTHGPSVHAINRKISVSTLFHHVRGKIAWAERVEPSFGKVMLAQFNEIRWPPIDYRWPPDVQGADDEEDE
jgi:RNA-directed DNA polymerase